MTYFTLTDSPLGKIKLLSDGAAITGLYFAENNVTKHIEIMTENPTLGIFELAEHQLKEYFFGERQRFDLPVKPHGTSFQRSVWNMLCEIPFGFTITYKELAARIKNPHSIRAVGQANGRNPISIIIPCHRIIGSNGSLTGYGGGIARKAALLDFEKAVLANGPHKLADRLAYGLATQPQS